MANPLFPTFDKRITDATDHIIQHQVIPWAFLKAGPKFSVKRFDGREISYQGVSYEGSPESVFWNGYIEPFLEALAIEEISRATSLSKERNLDLKEVLPQVEGLLISASYEVFDKMAAVDQKLRGKGFPESVPIRSTESEIGRMRSFISSHAKAELEMWKPKSRLQRLYEENTFLTWLIGAIFALTSLIFTAIKIFSP